MRRAVISLVGLALLAPAVARADVDPVTHAKADAAMQKAARRAPERLGPAVPAVTATRAVGGSWSSVKGIPDYAIHAALLHTGKVMLWGWQYNQDRQYTNPQTPSSNNAHRENVGQAFTWDTSKALPEIDKTDGAGAFAETAKPPTMTVKTYDASTGGFKDASVPVPIYCVGASFLANGDILLAGGTLQMESSAFNGGNGLGWKGLKSTVIYHPATNTWTRGPDLSAGHWYPSQVELADGRTLIVGGYNENGNEKDDPANNVLSADALSMSQPGTPLDLDVYPHLFEIPGQGNVLAVSQPGPTSLSVNFPGQPYDRNWLTGPTLAGANPSVSAARWASSAVIVPGTNGRTIMVLGGNPTNTNAPAAKSTETFDVPELNPADGSWSFNPWKAGPSLTVPRSDGNTVLLPTGGMVEVGGGSGVGPNKDLYVADDDRLKNVELYDPASKQWTLGNAQDRFRTYHSTALLLPDATVMSAGDDYHEDINRIGSTPPSGGNPGTIAPPGVLDAAHPAGTLPWRGSAEIYCPPYLFNADGTPADRPAIFSSPAQLSYGATFGVGAAGSIAGAVLMSPSAVTHSTDMTQRHLTLPIASRFSGKGVNVTAPPSATDAPPGWYMLFLLNGRGVPSVAKWVQLGVAAPPATTISDSSPTAPTPDPPARLSCQPSGSDTTPPVVTPTPTPTATATASPTPTATATASPTPTAAPTSSPAPTQTADPSPYTLPTPTPTPAPRKPDRTKPTLKLTLGAPSTKKQLKLSVRMSEAGTATVTVRVRGRKRAAATRKLTFKKAGTTKFTLTLKGSLPKGKYLELVVAAKDKAGNKASKTARRKLTRAQR